MVLGSESRTQPVGEVPPAVQRGLDDRRLLTRYDAGLPGRHDPSERTVVASTVPVQFVPENATTSPVQPSDLYAHVQLLHARVSLRFS